MALLQPLLNKLFRAPLILVASRCKRWSWIDKNMFRPQHMQTCTLQLMSNWMYRFYSSSLLRCSPLSLIDLAVTRILGMWVSWVVSALSFLFQLEKECLPQERKGFLLLPIHEKMKEACRCSHFPRWLVNKTKGVRTHCLHPITATYHLHLTRC